MFSSLQGGVRLRNSVQVTIAGQRGGVGEVSAEKMFSVLLLFVPREILMRKWKTEVVDMMFRLGRGSIVGLISEERGHEGGDREIWEARKVLPEFVSSVKQDQGCDIRLALQLMV